MRVLSIHGYGAKAMNTASTALLKNGYQPISPQLNYDEQPPSEILRLLMDTYEQEQCSAVIGSSMGGFFALQVTALKGCKAVLINPCITPFLIMPRENKYRLFIREYLNLMSNLARVNGDNVHVILGALDDVIDTHDFTKFYIGEKNCIIVPEGGHAGATLPLDNIIAQYGKDFFGE
ncbi:MAG: YqiA/YcfP family alpha/beta fold hydrolase [Oscillospiraceae bacterium]